MEERTPRFWIVFAAVSVCGTLSSLGTALALDHPQVRLLNIPDLATGLFLMVPYMLALGCSTTAVGSMLLEGVKETGRTPLYCLPMYAVPWLPLALLVGAGVYL